MIIKMFSCYLKLSSLQVRRFNHARKYYVSKEKLWNRNTSHSLSPWNPSLFSSFTATRVDSNPGLTFSSITPLYTIPKPPSPRIWSGLKYLVAALSSLYVNLLTPPYSAMSLKSSISFGGGRRLTPFWHFPLARSGGAASLPVKTVRKFQNIKIRAEACKLKPCR